MTPKELEKVQEALETSRDYLNLASSNADEDSPVRKDLKRIHEALSIISQAPKEPERKTKSMRCSHGFGSDCLECKNLGAEGEIYSGIDIDENKLPAEVDLQYLERAARDVVIYYDRQAFPNKDLKRSVDALAALLALREKSTNSTQTREIINLSAMRKGE